MRTLRALLAVLMVLSLVGLNAPPAGALEPFPEGDDDIRAFFELPGATCGTEITTESQVEHYENIPAGAEYYIRYIRRGVLFLDTGPFAPATLGTASITYNGATFGPQSYPTTVGILGRIDIGGKPTYIGGTLITCASMGATPVIEEIEDFAPPCGVGDTPAFPDVPASSSFCTDVQWAVDSGITAGFGDGHFRPGEAVTRQTMTAFLFRLAFPGEAAKPCLTPPFPDVPTTNPFCGTIEWAADEDIAAGFPDGNFRPTAVVSRQAMAAFLYRYSGSPLGDNPVCAEDAFPDVAVAHPFCGEIQWLAEQEIAGGYLDGSFRPATPVSRQAMTAFLYRMDTN